MFPAPNEIIRLKCPEQGLFSRASWKQIDNLKRIRKAILNSANPETYMNRALINRYNRQLALINARGDMLKLSIVLNFQINRKIASKWFPKSDVSQYAEPMHGVSD